MYTLSFYNFQPGVRNSNRSFDSLDAAIAYGRQTGQFYDVLQVTTGRTITWNELFWQVEDDDWYYDESELIWKKNSMDEETVVK